MSLFEPYLTNLLYCTISIILNDSICIEFLFNTFTKVTNILIRNKYVHSIVNIKRREYKFRGLDFESAQNRIKHISVTIIIYLYKKKRFNKKYLNIQNKKENFCKISLNYLYGFHYNHT